jgi:hypothetical protein
MADDIRIEGAPNADAVGWIRHLIEESRRLGEHVSDEGKETRREFAALRQEVNDCKSELKTEIAALDKAQSLTDKDLKIFVAKVSGGVSALVAATLMIIKSGVLAFFL